MTDNKAIILKAINHGTRSAVIIDPAIEALAKLTDKQKLIERVKATVCKSSEDYTFQYQYGHNTALDKIINMLRDE